MGLSKYIGKNASDFNRAVIFPFLQKPQCDIDKKCTDYKGR